MIYFVRSYCKKFIKVGTTEDLARRMRELQTSNPLPLKLLGVMPGSYKTESSLHEIFSKLRMGKSEWFKNAGDLKALQKLLSKGDTVNGHGLTDVRSVQKAIQSLRIRERANRQKSNKVKNKIRTITNGNS